MSLGPSPQSSPVRRERETGCAGFGSWWGNKGITGRHQILRVHLISNLFAPDELAGAALYTDFALFLKERGHDVRVTCCFSYYPAWRLRAEDIGVPFRDEMLEAVPLRRLAMHVPNPPTGKGRMLADASLLINLLRHGRHPGWVPEVVVTAIPMLSQAVALRFLYPGRRIPRLIIVQDFVVEAALELGILRFPGIEPALQGIQKWALRSAGTLVTISPKMLEKLQRGVGPDRRAVMIPNWIHGSLRAEIERQRGLGRTRVPRTLFYSGNLGVKQGLPDFLPTFAAVQGGDTAGQSSGGLTERGQGSWSLAIHGGGAESERLRSASAGIPGCTVGGVLREEEYIARLLGTAACLVTQRPGVGANFLPSKLLPALATGTPVLAVCDHSSPLAAEVMEGGFGDVVAPGDVDGLRRVLNRWASNVEVLDRYSERARVRSELYSRENVLGRYEDELTRLMSSR